MIIERILIVSKEEILAGNTNRIKRGFDSIAADVLDLFLAQNAYELLIHGYDNDPGELAEIPEVRDWIKKSIQDGIPWLYFLKLRDTRNLHFLIPLFGYVATRGKDDNDKMARLIIDNEALAARLKECMDNLFKFGEEHHIPESTIYEITIELRDALAELLL